MNKNQFHLLCLAFRTAFEGPGVLPSVAVGLDQLRGLRGQMGQMGQMAPNEKIDHLPAMFFFKFSRNVFSFFCDMKSVKVFFPCGASCQRLYWKKGTWIIGCFLFGSKKNLWGCSVGKHLSDNQTNAIPKGSTSIHHFRAKPSSLIKENGSQCWIWGRRVFPCCSLVKSYRNELKVQVEPSHEPNEPTILLRCLVFDQPWSEKKPTSHPQVQKVQGGNRKQRKTQLNATSVLFTF